MLIERTDEEVIVRLAADTDLSELQSMMDYLKYKEISSKSKATQEDADKLAAEAKKSIWARYKSEKGLQ